MKETMNILKAIHVDVPHRINKIYLYDLSIVLRHIITPRAVKLEVDAT